MKSSRILLLDNQEKNYFNFGVYLTFVSFQKIKMTLLLCIYFLYRVTYREQGKP